METLNTAAQTKDSTPDKFFKRFFHQHEHEAPYESSPAVLSDKNSLSYEVYAKNTLLGSYLKGNVSSLLLGLLGITMGFAALLYTLIKSSDPLYLPYIVTIDRQGALINHATTENQKIPENARTAFVCDFIEALYRVSPDREYQIKLIKSVYARLDDNSQLRNFIDTHFEKSEMLFSNKHFSREVVIESLLKKSTKTYELEFTLRTVLKDTKHQESFQALIIIDEKHTESRPLEELRLNPLGLYVTFIEIHKKIITKSQINASLEK